MNLALLKAELKRDEGVRRTPYLDTANPPRRTVGVGHNMDASPLPSDWTFPLSDAQIDQLLDHDLAVVFSGLDLHLPWWRGLDDVRARVVANLAYNMGIGDASRGTGLLGFRKALQAMKKGAWLTASEQMQASDWYRQVGQRAVRLCEAMCTDVMPDEPVIA